MRLIVLICLHATLVLLNLNNFVTRRSVGSVDGKTKNSNKKVTVIHDVTSDVKKFSNLHREVVNQIECVS